MGKTIDLETFKQNLINVVDGKDSLFETYVNDTELIVIFKEWFDKNGKLSTENSMLKLRNAELEEINKDLMNNIELKIEEGNKELFNEHEGLKEAYNKLLGHIDFMKSLFGRQ